MMKVSRKRKHILETIVVFLTSGIFMTFFLTNLGFASALPFFDYGDNPESYCTFSRDNGPYHINGRYEWFGEEEPDIEMDGQPTLNSDGDDNDNGFSFPWSIGHRSVSAFAPAPQSTISPVPQYSNTFSITEASILNQY